MALKRREKQWNYGDPIAGEPAETILVFFNGQLVQRAPVGEGRPYVAAYYKNPKLYASGFHLLLKSPLIEEGDTPIIRIFAAREDEFSELIYHPGYPWQEDPQSTDEQRSYASSCDPGMGASYLVKEAVREVEVEHSEQAGDFFDRLRKRGAEAGSELILPRLIFADLLRLREDQLKVEKSGFQVEIEVPL